MSTIIPAATSAQFLSHVPSLLGFHPVRSLVLVPFAAGRTLGGLRVDLPEVADTDDLEAMAATVIGLVCRVSRVDGVAAIVYGDEPLRDRAFLPHSALMEAVLSRADICGLQIAEALVVGPDAWASYTDDDAPRPLDELVVDSSVADLPIDADQFPSRQTMTDAGRLRKIRRAANALSRGDRHAASTEDPVRDEPATLPLDARNDLPLVLEKAVRVGADHLGIDEAAAVLIALQRPLFRDAALVQWASDLAYGERALAAQLAYTDGIPIPVEVGRVLCGRGPRPDPRRLRRARDLCQYVAAAAPRAERSGPLAAAAWLSWALGRSTHAGAYAAQARSIDPAHGLAGIVTTLVDGGHLPDWVFAAPTPEGVTSPAGTGSSLGCRVR